MYVTSNSSARLSNLVPSISRMLSGMRALPKATSDAAAKTTSCSGLVVLLHPVSAMANVDPRINESSAIFFNFDLILRKAE